jgi:hypothetical protein
MAYRQSTRVPYRNPYCGLIRIRVILLLRALTSAVGYSLTLSVRAVVDESRLVRADTLGPWLANVKLGADRAHRGNPVSRELPGEQLGRPLL